MMFIHCAALQSEGGKKGGKASGSTKNDGANDEKSVRQKQASHSITVLRLMHSNCSDTSRSAALAMLVSDSVSLTAGLSHDRQRIAAANARTVEVDCLMKFLHNTSAHT
jgi:hypothetical protein